MGHLEGWPITWDPPYQSSHIREIRTLIRIERRGSRIVVSLLQLLQVVFIGAAKPKTACPVGKEAILLMNAGISSRICTPPENRAAGEAAG